MTLNLNFDYLCNNLENMIHGINDYLDMQLMALACLSYWGVSKGFKLDGVNMIFHLGIGRILRWCDVGFFRINFWNVRQSLQSVCVWFETVESTRSFCPKRSKKCVRFRMIWKFVTMHRRTFQRGSLCSTTKNYLDTLLRVSTDITPWAVEPWLVQSFTQLSGHFPINISFAPLEFVG